MFRHAVRASLRSSQSSLAPARTIAGRRYVTTEPPHMKPRSWKNSALRWGIAIAGIYYYNTSPIFADHPQNNLLNPNVDALDDDSGSSTIDALTASSRRKSQRDASVLQSAVETASEVAASDSPSAIAATAHDNSMVAAPATGAAELEEEAEGEGAFNPVTGEINWDCPCLGGMAYGPCGPEFREAFSCFVYSQEEPKGMDCIDKFQKMQTCFRAHPEVYRDELEGDDELDEGLAQEKEELEKEIAERKSALDASASGSSQGRLLEEPEKASSKPAKASKTSSKADASKRSTNTKSPKDETDSKSSPAHVQSQASPGVESKTETGGYDNEHEHGAPSQLIKTPRTTSTSEALSEAEALVPKAAHDATGTPNKGAARQ